MSPAPHYDVVVVGGGSAGCVLAGRLSEDGRRVCLVEAGPDYGPYADGRWPTDILDSRQLAFSHAWETEREDRSQLRARIMGGCSAHNACLLLEAPAADYDEWGHGWSYAAIEPYLRRAERELRARQLERDELSPWHLAFVEAAGEAAIVHAVNAVGTVRWSTAFAYLDPARPRENLTVLADTLVDRVLLEGDRAVGVATTGGELRAEAVVLAAGAYGSPGVLLRSGVGPERGLPVGEGLGDHVGVGLGFGPTDELRREATAFARSQPLVMAQVTVGLTSNACADDAADLFLFPAIELVDGDYDLSAAAFAMKPRSRGSVSLTSSDPSAPLAIEHGFLSDPQDAEILAEGVERLRALAQTDALRRHAAVEVRPGPEVDPASHVADAVRGFFHPVATCAIGRVVDGQGRVHGLEGLFVADASIIPTVPRANTNLTTVALAERLAEGLR